LLRSARCGAAGVSRREVGAGRLPGARTEGQPLTQLQSRVLIGLASLLLVLVVVNAVLFIGNRQIQREVAQRNQVIQQSLQLEPIYQSLVRALAESAVARQDEALRALLASEGIQVSGTPAPAAPGGQ
jgi:hypothetical protein